MYLKPEQPSLNREGGPGHHLQYSHDSLTSIQISTPVILMIHMETELPTSLYGLDVKHLQESQADPVITE